jgi:transcription elongation factor GreA-like protein
MPALPFEQRRRETTAKLSALMLANAFIFQQQLANIHESVQPIRAVLTERDFIGKTASHWQMIIDEINYVPIFKVARDILLSLPANHETEVSVKRLAQRALEIVSKKAALRHDLMGRIYHLLLLEAKYLGTYYTSVPAATLLLKLTLDLDRWPAIDWSDPEALKRFRNSGPSLRNWHTLDGCQPSDYR